MIRIVAGFCFILTFTASAADCFDAAGRDYHIDPDLLRAVAFRESSMNPHAMNIVSPEKYAVGNMQIHSQNFAHLSQFGITPQKLYSDSCMNIYTGAYYLAIAFKRWGIGWDSVGAYNAGFSLKAEQQVKRQKYAKEVHHIYMNIKKQKATQP
ncbi:transglycosylase SLT domain-containing protein (plasmid) [Enterobacteriaceae bacterium Kacie_13]|nr:transglycosylase SLT domain-containing protein [Enterobacteriaceae bacterium Kacie_13]